MEEKILKHRQGGNHNSICKYFADIRSSVVGRQSSVVKPKFVINFTIVELLVVIAILAILAAMLLPALSNAKKASTAIACVGQIKQLGFASLQYAGDYNEWLNNQGMAPTAADSWYPTWGGGPHWMAQISDYVGITFSDANKYKAYHGIFNCPAQVSNNPDNTLGDNGFYGGYGWNYRGLGQNNTTVVNINGSMPRVRLNMITSPSETFMFGETCDQVIPTRTLAYFYLYYLVSIQCTPMRHNNGGNFTMADGHVEFRRPYKVWSDPMWFRNKNIAY